MAVREIKTALTLDNSKQFEKEINEAGRSMRVMASDMKAAAAEFEVTGDEMEYLGKKSKSLNAQIEQQEEIIRALEQAIEASAQGYGDAAAKTDGYRIKLNNAKVTLTKLKKETEDTDRRMEEMGRDSARVGRQLETGIGEAAEDVSKKFDAMVNKLDSDIGAIKSITSFSAIAQVSGQVTNAVSGAYNAVTGLVDESMEYNRTMAFLKVNAEEAGMSFESVKKMAQDVAGLTGDVDASVEGLSNLLQADLDATQLERTVRLLSGAIIQIPDTLKFESLADGLQETIATGSAVGQYAEYLERMGINLETVNEALENAGKIGQDAVKVAALSFLEENGALEALEKYKTEQQDMIAYFEAQAKLVDSQAKLAEVMTPAATAGIEAMSGFVDKITELIALSEEKFEAYRTKIEQTRKAEEEFAKIIDAETGYYTELAEINEKIKEADKAGNTQEANRLLEQRKEKIDQITQYAQEMAEGTETVFEETLEKEQTAIGAFFESFGRSLIGDYWYEHFFGDEEDLLSRIGTTGKNMVVGLSDSIDLNSGLVTAAIKRLMADAQAELNKGLVMPSISTGSGSSLGTTRYASSGVSSVTLSLDGKTLGKTTATYLSSAMGEAVARAEAYG